MFLSSVEYKFSYVSPYWNIIFICITDISVMHHQGFSLNTTYIFICSSVAFNLARLWSLSLYAFVILCEYIVKYSLLCSAGRKKVRFGIAMGE